MRKEKLDGKTVVVHERGDGIRRRFRESLADIRWTYPRKGLVHHPREWFLSERPLARPVFGVYAMASFAEDMLWRAKFGRGGRIPRVEEAMPFFSATRAALQNVLSTYRIDFRLTAKEVRSLRKVVAKLISQAKALVERMNEDFTNRKETHSV
jgi:hypothetical protein